MSCPNIEEYGLLNLEMLDVVEKDPVAPAPVSPPSSLTQILKRKNRSYKYPRNPALQSQRRLPIPEGKIRHCTGQIFSNTARICHLQAKSNLWRLVKGEE